MRLSSRLDRRARRGSRAVFHNPQRADDDRVRAPQIGLPVSAGCRAAELAMAQASRLRDCGLDVVLILDSLARYAQALREIALSYGEPPGRGGYPPMVFARLAALCECAGATANGSVTLLATVLSDIADPSDPLAEAARSHLDGHLVLSRSRAERGAFPAIDVPASLSRPMPAVVDSRHLGAAARIRAALAPARGLPGSSRPRTSPARPPGTCPRGLRAPRFSTRAYRSDPRRAPSPCR